MVLLLRVNLHHTESEEDTSDLAASEANPDQTPAPNRDRGTPEEIAALLRLVGVLGLTMVLGISTFFGLGLLADRHFDLHGAGIITGLLAGIGLSLYWSYSRIARHLDRFAPHNRNQQQ